MRRISRWAKIPRSTLESRKRSDAEFDQSRDRSRGIAGVHRRKDEVAGERRLNGHVRSFFVADLADHDDVGVLSQDRAQRRREGHVDLRVDLNLAKAWVDHLDRVFDARDVDFRSREIPQRRVERGRLAGTGRTRHEDQARWGR